MTWFRLRRTCEPSRAEVGKPTTWTMTAASHDPEGRGHHCGISPASQLKAYEPEANAERLFRPIARRDQVSAVHLRNDEPDPNDFKGERLCRLPHPVRRNHHLRRQASQGHPEGLPWFGSSKPTEAVLEQDRTNGEMS